MQDRRITIDVICDDTDLDGNVDPPSVAILLNSTTSSAVRYDDRTLTYTPDNDFCGDDSLIYTAQDNEGATSTETTVAVIPRRRGIGWGD